MALSATCRWGPAMHLISLLNSFGISGSNFVISHTSKTLILYINIFYVFDYFC